VHRSFPFAAAILFAWMLACGTPYNGPNTTPVACMPGDASVPVGTNLVTEDAQGSCPTAPLVTIGTGAAGTSCASYKDCAPVCCACGTHGLSALVAGCSASPAPMGGTCLSANELCCGYSATPTCK
jgi:hypothetical protein